MHSLKRLTSYIPICSRCSWGVRNLSGCVTIKAAPDVERYYCGHLKKHIKLIDTVEACKECLPELIANDAIAVDCEGVNLGRFGKLCLMQIATKHGIFIFDCLREGILKMLTPILANKNLLKVMHDCREDSAALYGQFGIKLQNVYDTQVAHKMLIEREKYPAFQISLNDLLLKTLKISNLKKTPTDGKMGSDPNLWYYRPIQQELIEYAIQDVLHLAAARLKLNNMLGEHGGESVVAMSQAWVDYCHLNEKIEKPQDIMVKGCRLKGMCTAHSPQGIYFKLNMGDKHGAVSLPEPLARFQNVKLGDTVDVLVSNWNPAGTILFLEKYNEALAWAKPTNVEDAEPLSKKDYRIKMLREQDERSVYKHSSS